MGRNCFSAFLTVATLAVKSVMACAQRNRARGIERLLGPRDGIDLSSLQATDHCPSRSDSEPLR